MITGAAEQCRHGAVAAGGKSLLLAPYWLDGHYLSAQTALRLGYKQVADAIRDEVTDFLARLPALINLLFNDRTPFVSEQTKQWLASSGSVNQTVPVVQTDEELQAAKACFDENGLEAALRYRKTCPKVIPATSFTASFRRAVTGRGRYGSACTTAVPDALQNRITHDAIRMGAFLLKALEQNSRQNSKR